LALTT